MRKICFITGSRADYGIMSELMKAVAKSPEAVLQVVATNMHLSERHGMTVNEIINDGLRVDFRVPTLTDDDSPRGIAAVMSRTLQGMADAYETLTPDLLVILGDRYEMLAAASAAIPFHIPIAHLHGGETTEGAFDDSIRHAITKLSTLHFASTREYADRIIRMGEAPERVFYVGSLALENIEKEKLLSLTQLEDSLEFRLGDKYIVVAFHPATNEPGMETEQTENLIKALTGFIPKGYKILITLPNSDNGGIKVREILIDWSSKHNEEILAIPSLGRVRFHSALKHCSAIVGNSSAGLIEAPSFRIPTINIGSRQKGRARGITVIDCFPSASDISKAIETAISPEFVKEIKDADYSLVNPYYKKDSLECVLSQLINAPLPKVKPFVD